MEKELFFSSKNILIEGLLDVNSTESVAIVTHPHPLYGGDMRNAVVETIVDTYRENSFSTLRFNFRGVGRSQGHFSDGQGERDDVLAAMSYLRGIGFQSFDLVGYSFGSWVLSRLGSINYPIRKMVFVSPPVAFMDFSSVASISGLDHIVVGSRDEFAPFTMVNERHAIWNPNSTITVIEGADHFFSGFIEELRDILRSII